MNKQFSSIFCLKNSILSDLSIEEIEILKKASLIKEIKKYQFLKTPGETSLSMYILINGLMKKGQYSYAGKEYSSFVIRPNTIFGSLSSIESNDNHCFYQAIENSKIICVKKKNFEYLIKTNGEFSLKILSIIDNRVKEMEDKYANMVFSKTKGGVIGFLISLANDIGKKVGTDILIEHNLSQQEMANFIGYTRQTVSTIISNLNKENIIYSGNRNVILIRDMQLLKNYQHA